ncbi:hypothetical protein ILUMI_12044 [Ignelater luminosus]|uniref:Uncharacterized protein n=1 Tax=Ignelater luminosus TaxID=2038154 RepID=A0A8K0D3Q5_IGNLU|nr:hypothetical protein ILUMI_12044 [Ignelater luminosus]
MPLTAPDISDFYQSVLVNARIYRFEIADSDVFGCSQWITINYKSVLGSSNHSEGECAQSENNKQGNTSTEFDQVVNVPRDIENLSGVVENPRVVCKEFFLSTLDVSKKQIMHTALVKLHCSYDNVPVPDDRERHKLGVKIPENIMALTKEHIDLFPTVPAYWRRKDSKKYYECDLQKPENQAEKLEEYEIQKNKKDAANSVKKKDGKRAKNDKTFVTVNFDLKAALYCPLLFA